MHIPESQTLEKSDMNCTRNIEYMYLASHRRNFSTNLFWLFYTILAQTQWFRNLDIKFEALCDLTIKSNNENSEFSNTTTSFENIIEAIEKIPDKPDVKTNYDNDPEAEFELIYKSTIKEEEENMEVWKQVETFKLNTTDRSMSRIALKGTVTRH